MQNHNHNQSGAASVATGEHATGVEREMDDVCRAARILDLTRRWVSLRAERKQVEGELTTIEDELLELGIILEKKPS